MNITRRAALKGGAAIAALGAPLAVLPFDAEAADAVAGDRAGMARMAGPLQQ